MKKILLSYIVAINILFSADTQNNQEILNMGEDIFNENILGDGQYVNENVALTPKQKARIDIAKRKQRQAEEELEKVKEENQKLQENINYKQYMEQNPAVNQNNYQNNEQEDLNLLRASIRNQDLKAIQKTFFNKKYSGFENTQEYNFENKKTQKIATRMAMATTLIFDSEIESTILGDTTGFKIEEIPNKSNAIAIKPLLIGIDTSLTIFTKDKRIHSFYVYSTDYKDKKDPALIIYIKDQVSQNLKNLSEKEKEENYLILNKDQVNELAILKSDINRNYVQKVKKENEWLLAEEIFSDKKFTYFKYSKDKLPQIPAIFAVIDKQDSPIETRILGDYIIAETINPKFTIKSGESYVCVENQNQIQREIKTKINEDIKEEYTQKTKMSELKNEPKKRNLYFDNYGEPK